MDGSVLSKLKSFDAYPKTLDDVRVKTYAGAAVTLISSVIIAVLFISEFTLYLDVNTKTELVVDVTRDQKMRINFNITFPRLSCHARAPAPVASVDVMDLAGEHQSDIEQDIYKVPLTAQGEPMAVLRAGTESTTTEVQEVATPLPENYCGSCYGAESQPRECCNSCAAVTTAYRRKGWSITDSTTFEQCKREGHKSPDALLKSAGCNIYGRVDVNKVAGNLHIAPGKSFQANHMHIHDINSFVARGEGNFDLSHVVERLSFGEEFPNIINPLDRNRKDTPGKMQMYQYFVKVVPTDFVYINGTVLKTNQFSYTENSQDSAGRVASLPGVFFHFDISPMRVIYRQSSLTVLQFLTSVCAIVGGVFTVASLIDGFIYSANRTLKRKIQLGKAS